MESEETFNLPPSGIGKRLNREIRMRNSAWRFFWQKQERESSPKSGISKRPRTVSWTPSSIWRCFTKTVVVGLSGKRHYTGIDGLRSGMTAHPRRILASPMHKGG